MTSSYRNILIFLLIIFAFVFISFFETYFGLFPGFKNTNTLVHIHVAMIMLWFALLIAQPLMITTKNTAVHRLLGKLSYIVVPLLIVSCILMTRQEQLRQKNMIVFAANIIDLSIFASLYLLALKFRRKFQWHGRLMMLTILPFISPSAARLNLNGLAIQLSVLVILLLVERASSRQYKPYLLGFSTYVCVYLPVIFVSILAPGVMDSLWKFFFF